MAGRSWSTALVPRILGFLIATYTYGTVVMAAGSMDEGSGYTEGLQPYPNGTTDNGGRTEEPTKSSPDLSRCVGVSEAINNSLIFDVCIDYLPPDKNFIYDYGIDFKQLESDLKLLNAALGTSSIASPFCMDLTRAYTCNYVYPGCSNETGLPQGICMEECERYVVSDVCSGEFRSLETITETIGKLSFKRQCDDTLLLLQDFGINTENISHSDCIDIMGTITKLPDSESSSLPEPTVGSGTSHGHTSLPIKIALPLVSVILLMLLGGTLIIGNIYKARKDKRKSSNPLESVTITNEYSQWLEGDRDGKAASHGLFQLSKDDVRAFWKDDKLRAAIVSTDNIYITGELGEGAFGRVFKGLLVTEDPSEESGRKIVQIAIKTVKNTQGMYRELKAFIEESALMCSFNHPHVLGMVGICLDTVQSPYLLLPYMANGDLRTFLRNKRDSSKSSDTGYPEGLDYSLLVRMCYEVATGMEYLASKKLVHRDLAARNCMVDQDFSVKVADFGLARVIYQTDYYRQHQQMKVPVKWMAPESLHDMISTEKSDVWSYGVVCWEVFSLGRLPYPTLANHEVVDYLERGNRLKKPALCSDVIYEIMLKCWENVADKRPTFTEIVSRYHDGLVMDTSKAEQGRSHAGYVLLGPEEERRAAEHPLKKLSKTQSIVDISTISLKDLKISSTPSTGTTFNVTFLSPRVGGSRVGEESNPGAECAAAMPDQEYYIKMERNCVLSDCAEENGNVLVNQAALHEYDVVTPQDQQEEIRMEVGVSSHGERRDGHVTTDSDHLTSGSNHCLKSPVHANEDYKLNASASDYILMRAARDHISDM